MMGESKERTRLARARLGAVLVVLALVAAGAAPSHAGPNDRRLTVVISGGEGTVTSAPAGIACTETCTADFPADATVTLTPQPAPGFVFSRWDGDCQGASCAVAMAGQERTAVAIFRRPGASMLELWPAGRGTVNVSPAGRDRTGSLVTSCSAERADLRACALAFDTGTTVTLTPVAAAGSPFQRWSNEACPGTGACTLQLAEDVESLTAFFAQPLLSVRVSGGGSVESDDGRIKCGGGQTTCVADYPAGATVRLTASGSSSIRWTFGCDLIESAPDPDNPALPISVCVVTVTNRPLTVAASFGNAPTVSDVFVRLKVVRSGGGSGAVRGERIDCGARCLATYPFGTRLTLRAEEAAGSRFDRWRGACAAERVCSVQVGAVTAVQALFEPEGSQPRGNRALFTVALEGAGVTGRRAGRRVFVRASVNRPARVRLRLRRGGRLVASGTRTLRRGSSRAFLAVPRRAPRGRYRLEILVTATGAGSARFNRTVVLPR